MTYTDMKSVPPFHKRAITIQNEELFIREESSIEFPELAAVEQ